MFLAQENSVCDGIPDCPDGSDKLCGDSCVPESYKGKYTMKVNVLFAQRNLPQAMNSDHFTMFRCFCLTCCSCITEMSGRF